MGLFDVVQAGRFHAKNRFVRAATKEELCDGEGHIPEKIYELYEKIAQGGVGTIIVSSSRVKLFPGTEPQGLFRLDKMELLPEYRKLAEIGKSYGCTMLIQATYSHKDINKLSLYELAEVASQYAFAASFAEQAGFDGIEIHEAHNMFMCTVPNPNLNRRTDEYGINKHLLAERVIEAIRQSISKDFIIVSKIDSSNDKGYTADNSIEHCKAIAAAGVDAIEVSGGDLRQVVKTRDQESYFKEFAIRLKKEVSIPVILVGGNKSFDVMSELNENYSIDLFSMSRAITREFDLINRWRGKDKSSSNCMSCGACYNTYGHLCPFNTDNPF